VEGGEMKLKLYVWEDFRPDWTEGLAFAIAENIEEAEQILFEKMGVEKDSTGMEYWGAAKEFPIKKIGFYVNGGR
jgi:hypothetical protein